MLRAETLGRFVGGSPRIFNSLSLLSLWAMLLISECMHAWIVGSVLYCIVLYGFGQTIRCLPVCAFKMCVGVCVLWKWPAHLPPPLQHWVCVGGHWAMFLSFPFSFSFFSLPFFAVTTLATLLSSDVSIELYALMCARSIIISVCIY